MPDIKEDLLAIWVSFTEAITRFWNNRFQPVSDEIIYLRHQIEAERAEKQKLLNLILEMNQPRPAEQEPEDNTDYKPVMPSYIPWHIQKQRLEMASRNRAIELGHEAAKAKDLEKQRAKSTEQLEEELGIRESAQ